MPFFVTGHDDARHAAFAASKGRAGPWTYPELDVDGAIAEAEEYIAAHPADCAVVVERSARPAAPLRVDGRELRRESILFEERAWRDGAGWYRAGEGGAVASTEAEIRAYLEGGNR